jgi:hypothetical protein
MTWQSYAWLALAAAFLVAALPLKPRVLDHSRRSQARIPSPHAREHRA